MRENLSVSNAGEKKTRFPRRLIESATNLAALEALEAQK